MTRRTPTPVRFDTDVAERLSAFAAARPGLSLSGAANLLVDEGLRMAAHPGIVFRDGPAGRRAGLAGGPDVWEVARALKAARTAEPSLDEEQVLGVVSTNTGLPFRMVRTAVDYWVGHAAEIDAQIATAERAERQAEEAWLRERDILAR